MSQPATPKLGSREGELKDGPLTQLVVEMLKPRKYSIKKSAIKLRIRGLFSAQIKTISEGPEAGLRASLLDCLADLNSAEALIK